MTILETPAQRIGASVEDELFDTLWKLVAGEIELHDCSDALQAWWAVAHADGYNAGYATTNEWLRHDRDRWYWVASNPGRKPGDYLTHITHRLWEEADRGEAY